MALDDATRQRIEQILDSKPVVLFMKGTPQMPQCGFSATTAGILDTLLDDYAHVNVLADQEIREGIKAYANWPTIPQLYINKEFVGGCDIVTELYNSGELHEMLGMEKPDRTPPEIQISDKAAEAIKAGIQGQQGDLHLSIDKHWQHQFTIQPAKPHEIKASANGIDIYMDVATAQRAKGLSIDWVDSFQGSGLKIDNPNAPKPVNQLSATELKAMMDQGEPLHLIDVRPESERAIAVLPNDERLDEQKILSLPKDTTLVFYCRTGNRSNGVAEHFRQQGFTNVHNLAGGIHGWHNEVDPSVRKY